LTLAFATKGLVSSAGSLSEFICLTRDFLVRVPRIQNQRQLGLNNLFINRKVARLLLLVLIESEVNMNIHHLSCGTMCPFGGGLMDGITPHLGHSTLVCHCLLIETDSKLILVDTGFGTQDILHPHKRLSPFFRILNQPRLDMKQTAIHQIRELGFDPNDVTDIVLTHLDFDHAGGITDFPNAKIHLYATEYKAALRSKGFIQGQRFRPIQWQNHKSWKLYNSQGEKWFGFDSVRELEGLPPEILIIPLVGHTWGHCGIAVEQEHRWLLLAGDAYFNNQEMNLKHPHAPKGAAAYETMMEVDRELRLMNQDRLRRLIATQGRHVQVFCSHDPKEFMMMRSLQDEQREHIYHLRESNQLRENLWQG
jgi:glyoxylase-like metal-dependent hydrolase (beta-lactamase superfamily II)